MPAAWQLVEDAVRSGGAYHGEPSPGQTTAGNHSPNSWHYARSHGGHALDMGRSDGDPQACFNLLESAARSGALTELFYRDQQYRQGRRINSPDISRSHQHHCHGAVAPGREGEIAALSRPFAPGERTIRVGSRGPDVVAWQRHVDVADDGVFGTRTEEATRNYQVSKGLTADGVVGPQTWAAYRQDMDPSAPPPPPGMKGRITVGMRGIDVSHHQEPVDWTRVRGAGYGFAIVRASYGGSPNDLDRRYLEHRDGARIAGLVVGHYHFAYPGGDDALTEANHFIQVLGSMPAGEFVVLDIERGSGNVAVWARVWLGVVEKAVGRLPLVYGYPAFLRDQLPDPALAHYPLWIAHYDVERPDIPLPWGAAVIWQQSSTGHVPGVVGNCDLNLCLAELPASCFGGAAPIPDPPPPPPPPPDWTEEMIVALPTLRRGSTSQATRNLQGLLAAAGRRISIDGNFGPGTETVLREWQAAAGVEPDGVCGPLTWRTLLGA